MPPHTASTPAPPLRPATLEAPGALPVDRSLLSAGVLLDPETEREREARLEALKTKLRSMSEAGQLDAALDLAFGAMVRLERENERLAWRLLRAIRYRFGRQSERLSHDELSQLVLALGLDEAEAAKEEPQLLAPPAPTDGSADGIVDGSGAAGETTATSGADAPELVPPKGKRRLRKQGAGTTLASHIERIVDVVAVTGADRTCALCGGEKKSMGTVDHEVISFVPAKIVVRVEQREQLACAACKKDVVAAPRQTQDLGRRFDATFHAKLLKDKCANALPLDRQRRELARMGADIPDKTLASCWAYATDLLAPVAEAQRGLVFGSPIVGADDTHLRTLDRASKGGLFRARFWCFVGSEGGPGATESVAYGYAASWKASEIQDWFAAIDGTIQCDAYAGYAAEQEDAEGHPFVAVPDARRLGCMMHVRSKFHAALLGRDKRAAVPLQLIGKIYEVEAHAKAQRMTAAERGELRRERSLSLLDALDAWVDEVHPRLLPKAPLRIATHYARTQRPFVRACFSDGRFEIDNGRTERRIRPFAVGRRNFLFTGSPAAGARLATAFTLVDNCLILGVDPLHYLADVMLKIEHGWPVRRLTELTPQRWAIERGLGCVGSVGADIHLAARQQTAEDRTDPHAAVAL